MKGNPKELQKILSPDEIADSVLTELLEEIVDYYPRMVVLKKARMKKTPYNTAIDTLTFQASLKFLDHFAYNKLASEFFINPLAYYLGIVFAGTQKVFTDGFINSTLYTGFITNSLYGNFHQRKVIGGVYANNYQSKKSYAILGLGSTHKVALDFKHSMNEINYLSKHLPMSHRYTPGIATLLQGSPETITQTLELLRDEILDKLVSEGYITAKQRFEMDEMIHNSGSFKVKLLSAVDNPRLDGVIDFVQSQQGRLTKMQEEIYEGTITQEDTSEELDTYEDAESIPEHNIMESTSEEYLTVDDIKEGKFTPPDIAI